MSEAEHKQRCNRNIIARIAAAYHRQSHAHRRIPEKDRARNAADGRAIGQIKRQPRQEPQSGERKQRAAAGGRLAGPGRYRCEQKAHHHRPGIAPNHFMRVPVKRRQLGRALIAKAPQ